VKVKIPSEKARQLMTYKSILQLLLGEFYTKLDQLDDLVTREASFPQAPNKIKVAIGMRRVGKTYFLYQHIKKIMQEGIDRKRILFINFEDDRLLPMNAPKLAQLVDAFYSLYPENHTQKCYLFLDEIQNVENWPLVIRRFHDTLNVEIFLTGSSAKLLSKEIATNLRGRSLALEIWPYSFTEFLSAKKITIESDIYDKKRRDLLKQYFHDYLSIGGFPEVVHYPFDVRHQTLQDYLDIVIYRDIIERHTIRNPSIIKYMILSMIHNVGKPFTINKFYNDLRSQGHQSGKDILYEYAEHIEDSYVAFSIGLHDRSIRKVRANPKKIYAIDPGLVRSVMLNDNNDFGKLFENVIYLDLRRKGCTISYYLTSNRNEVDFVVETSHGQKKCLQVAWAIDHQETFEREQRALEEAMNELHIEGEIVTLDSYLEKGGLMV
jgi:uncharacterized protein